MGHREGGAGLMGVLSDITAGEPRKLVRPVFFTVLSDLINIVPFVLVIAAVGMIFEPFIHPGTPMNLDGLWRVSAALLLYMVVIFAGEVGAYRASYRAATQLRRRQGRPRRAPRRLPLGYLTRRDPGDLANMMMGDFTQIEQSLSHNSSAHRGLILPIFALVGLAFLDWRMRGHVHRAADVRPDSPRLVRSTAFAGLQAHPGEDQCGQPAAGVPERHSGNQGLQPLRKPVRPPGEIVSGVDEREHPVRGSDWAGRPAGSGVGAGRVDSAGARRRLPSPWRDAGHFDVRHLPGHRVASL